MNGVRKKVTKKMYTVCKDTAPIITAPRCETVVICVMDMTNPKPTVKIKCDLTIMNSPVAQRQSKIANIKTSYHWKDYNFTIHH